MVAVLVGACASPAQAPAQPMPPGGGAQPGTALGVFPPNATRVIARVQQVSGDTLTLAIEDARQAQPDLPMGPANGTIQVVSRETLPAGLAGRRIEATVKLTGDTMASRWFVSDIRTLP
jgi:hypothetical protein